MKLDLFTKRGIARLIMWTMTFIMVALVLIQIPSFPISFGILLLWAWSVANSGIND